MEAEPEPHHGAHESPPMMTFPLVILAALAIIGGWVGVPFVLGGENEIEHFLHPVFHPMPAGQAFYPEFATGGTTEVLLALVSVLTAAAGFYFAWLLYYREPGKSTKLVEANPYTRMAYNLLDHKYWVDEIYQRGIVLPLLGVSRVLLNGLVDTGIVQGSAWVLAESAGGVGWLVRRVQSGNIRSYAGWLALGAACVIVIVLFGYHPLLH